MSDTNDVDDATDATDDRLDGLGEHARDGMAHLQNAAKELIAAGRALLDAVEELVDDPVSMNQLSDALGTIAKVAGSALAGTQNQTEDHADDHDEEPRVQRIRIS